MKKMLFIALFTITSSCTQQGFVNIKIQNLASKDIYIEGRIRNICNSNSAISFNDFCMKNYSVTDFVKYRKDFSKSFGLSNWTVRSRWQNLETKKEFEDLDALKIYYKSKSCLIFKYDKYRNDTIINLYMRSMKNQSILALTVNGIEILNKEEYESQKDKYTLNDSNVKCLKDVR